MYKYIILMIIIYIIIYYIIYFINNVLVLNLNTFDSIRKESI